MLIVADHPQASLLRIQIQDLMLRIGVFQFLLDSYSIEVKNKTDNRVFI
jgi:hypothetical protein